METMRLGLLGLGTVGGGTVNVLRRNKEDIARRAGREIQVVRAATRSLSKNRICPTDDIELDSDAGALVDDPRIDVVVELMGGTEPARELVLRALANGKPVVTANKALIALHGRELFAAAAQAGVPLLFEAAVAGGIPIIKSIREGLAGNRIECLAGIINGTSNFILSEMSDGGRPFADVLAEAQRLGYAEADPTFDIEGIDAAHKLTILASIAFACPLDFERVYVEGITQIAVEDIEYARQLGYKIKHLGIARAGDEGIELRVHPTLVPQRRLLANVDGVKNAVLVKGDAVGDTLHYGAGAGAEPTASAVIADLIDVAATLGSDSVDVVNRRSQSLAVSAGELDAPAILPMSESVSASYLRMSVVDKPGTLANIATILGDSGISIEAVVQPEPPRGAGRAKLVLLTHEVRERQMLEALERLHALDSVSGPATRIRLEHLDFG